MSMPGNIRWPSSLFFHCKLYRVVESIDVVQKFCQFFCPCGQMAKMSSTYMNQHTGLCVACSIDFFEKSSMKNFAFTGQRGAMFTAPSVCT
jgi:hypothetical protein